MRYIKRDIQLYLTPQQKEEYKRIKNERNEYIRKNPLPSVTLFYRWNGKTWRAQPTKRQIWYVREEKDKKVVKRYYNMIEVFDEKIAKIERHGMENKEIEICKVGNMIKATTGWLRNENYIVQEKESRDYYSLIRVSDMRTRIMKWTDIVKYFDLSDISK